MFKVEHYPHSANGSFVVINRHPSTAPIFQPDDGTRIVQTYRGKQFITNKPIAALNDHERAMLKEWCGTDPLYFRRMIYQ